MFVCVGVWLYRCVSECRCVGVYGYMCVGVCLLLLYVLATSKFGYRLVTVHTHGEFIALPHWHIRPPARVCGSISVCVYGCLCVSGYGGISV